MDEKQRDDSANLDGSAMRIHLPIIPASGVVNNASDEPTMVLKNVDAPTIVMPNMTGAGMPGSVAGGETTEETSEGEESTVVLPEGLGKPASAAVPPVPVPPQIQSKSAASTAADGDGTSHGDVSHGDVVDTLWDIPPINFPASVYDEAAKTSGDGADLLSKPLTLGDQPDYQSEDGSGAITPQQSASDPQEYADALVAEPEKPKPKRNPWIIVAIVVAVLVLGGLLIGGWSYWNSLKNDTAHSTALAQCNDSRSQYNKAESALQTALDGTKDAQAIAADAVADGSTVDALRQAVDTANGLGQAQNCLYIATTDQLTQAANANKTLIGKVNDAATTVTSAAKTVTDSRDAKTLNDAKTALQNEISTAQTLLDGSAGAVADDSTRTALQNAINDANNALGQDDPTAMRNAVTALQNAEKNVQASKDAYTAQQQAAQRRAQQSQNDSSDSDSDSDRSGGTSGRNNGYSSNSDSGSSDNSGNTQTPSSPAPSAPTTTNPPATEPSTPSTPSTPDKPSTPSTPDKPSTPSTPGNGSGNESGNTDTGNGGSDESGAENESAAAESDDAGIIDETVDGTIEG